MYSFCPVTHRDTCQTCSFFCAHVSRRAQVALPGWTGRIINFHFYQILTKKQCPLAWSHDSIPHADAFPVETGSPGGRVINFFGTVDNSV